MSADRTTEHAENERQAELAGVPYCELTRTLRFTLYGIRYQIFAAIISWRAEDDNLHCGRCGQHLTVLAPNLLHSLPMAFCACAAGFLEPLDDRDQALLELAHPISKEDAKLAEKFHRELSRLAATKNQKNEGRSQLIRVTTASRDFKKNELNATQRTN